MPCLTAKVPADAGSSSSGGETTVQPAEVEVIFVVVDDRAIIWCKIGDCDFFYHRNTSIGDLPASSGVTSTGGNVAIRVYSISKS